MPEKVNTWRIFAYFSYGIRSALYLFFLPLLLNIEMENLNEFPRNSVFSI